MSKAQKRRDVRGVIMPLSPLPLLLPNAALAEVISYRQPEAWENAPPWFLGLLDWRHRLIPIVNASVDSSTEMNFGHRARIAVCNTLNGNDRLPFIGIVTEEIPHLVRLTENNLDDAETSYQDGVIKKAVRVTGVDTIIPDLDWLEKQVTEQLASAS